MSSLSLCWPLSFSWKSLYLESLELILVVTSILFCAGDEGDGDAVGTSSSTKVIIFLIFVNFFDVFRSVVHHRSLRTKKRKSGVRFRVNVCPPIN